MDNITIKQTPEDYFLAAYGGQYYAWNNKKDFMAALNPEVTSEGISVEFNGIDVSKAKLLDRAGLLQAMAAGKVYGYIEEQRALYIMDEEDPNEEGAAKL